MTHEEALAKLEEWKAKRPGCEVAFTKCYNCCAIHQMSVFYGGLTMHFGHAQIGDLANELVETALIERLLEMTKGE